MVTLSPTVREVAGGFNGLELPLAFWVNWGSFAAKVSARGGRRPEQGGRAVLFRLPPPSRLHSTMHSYVTPKPVSFMSLESLLGDRGKYRRLNPAWT